MDVLRYNREAWDRESAEGSEWSTPVTPEEIALAREGRLELILTPNLPVPRDWLGEVNGARVLCLASAGGQQAPLLAAAGAEVTSFDLSAEQLAKDRLVAEREGLEIELVEGDMADLSVFADARFDLVFHPTSNVFVPDLDPVWRECHRVLRAGGNLLSGFVNPVFFLFDHDEVEATGKLEVRHPLPYSDLESLQGEARRRFLDEGRAAEWSHSLDAQIGGQIDAGFVITGFFEDTWDDAVTPLNRFIPLALATRARKEPS